MLVPVPQALYAALYGPLSLDTGNLFADIAVSSTTSPCTLKPCPGKVCANVPASDALGPELPLDNGDLFYTIAGSSITLLCILVLDTGNDGGDCAASRESLHLGLALYVGYVRSGILANSVALTFAWPLDPGKVSNDAGASSADMH